MESIITLKSEKLRGCHMCTHLYKSLCTWWLRDNRQVHRDFLLTPHFAFFIRDWAMLNTTVTMQ